MAFDPCAQHIAVTVNEKNYEHEVAIIKEACSKKGAKHLKYAQYYVRPISAIDLESCCVFIMIVLVRLKESQDIAA